MDIDVKAMITGGAALWLLLRRWYNEISKIVEPVVKEIEALAIDGKIDKADRKKIALKAVAELEAQKIIRLNFISRLVVSLVIDRLAAKLPDYAVTENISRVVGQGS